MGYSTVFTIEVKNAPAGFDVHAEIVKFMQEQGYERFNPFEDACKWYDWQKDMNLFSSRFPDVVFIITGEGEDPKDHWKAYVYNGQHIFCRAKIIYREPTQKELDMLGLSKNLLN